MSEAKSIPFQFAAGQPCVVSVTAADGSPYEIRVAVAVFEVIATGGKNPDGTDEFEVRAGITLDTRKPGVP